MNEFLAPSLMDTLSLLPIVWLAVMACVPITIKVLNQNKEPSNSLSLGFGLAGIILSFVTLATQSAFSGRVFNGALILDHLSSFASYGVLLIGASSLLLSASNVNTKGQSFAEHIFLLLYAMIGMLILVGTDDLIVAFIGLELMSIALYILIALGHEQEASKEAAFKYFLLGSFASAIFLYGIAFIYGLAGTTQLSPAAIQAIKMAGSGAMTLVAIVCLLGGVAFKVSLVPFHAWTPDVYQGAPTSVTAFMATGVKLVMFTFLLRVASSGLLAIDPSIVWVMSALAVLTMTVGNITAIVQDNVKRLIAYSSVAHAGYVMVGVVAASTAKTPEAGSGTLYYLIIYSIMNLGAFAVVSLFEREQRGNLAVSDYAGLGFKNPFLGLGLAIFMISLAGIPPTAGFLGKFYIFSAAVKEGYLWLAVFGVINSLISVYYYLRVLVYLYMEEPLFDVQAQRGLGARVVVASGMAAILILGVFSTPVYREALATFKSLF